jgi:hypothetical protein
MQYYVVLCYHVWVTHPEAGEYHLGLQGPSMGVYKASQRHNTHSPTSRTLRPSLWVRVCGAPPGVLCGGILSYVGDPYEAGEYHLRL